MNNNTQNDLSEKQVQTIALRNTETPDFLPRPWLEMTPSEQAMTLWFVSRMSYFDRSKMGWYLIGTNTQAKGRALSEQERDTLWELVFPKDTEN